MPLPGTERGYTPSRRRTTVSRLALLAILVLQALMSLRLRSTVLEDEALYLDAGRLELAHLLHGAVLQGSYTSSFSGAPVLYPVLGAALNAVGGLALARALSLAEMLAVTAMLYSITRSLFNDRVALCAAALFSVSESAIFLGHLATFDATCVFLLACATAIAVRWSASRWPVFLLAAPLAALAVAVKYAGLLYVPTIAVLPAIAGWPALGRRALLRPPAFAAVVAGLLYGALRLGGPAYVAAISGTTTNRAQGGVPALTILRESAAWGGALAVLAVGGAVAYTIRPRTEPGEQLAWPGNRRCRAALGAVLAGTAFLAPACQMHLHTDVSLLKHVGLGLFFAAPLAGAGLVRLVGDHFRRPQVGIALWTGALVLAVSSSWNLYRAWPSSGPLVTAIAAHDDACAVGLTIAATAREYARCMAPGIDPDRPARVEDVHELAAAMPHATRWPTGANAIYQVGGKSFVFFRNPRPDATDPVTGERYDDVIMFWVPSEADKHALVQDPDSPFFTTAHFDGHPSVLIRASRLGELSYAELAEVVQDAWLCRASARRAAAWLDSRGQR